MHHSGTDSPAHCRPKQTALSAGLSKACGHSFEGHEAGGEIDHGLKALIGLVIASGDAAELLQGAEEVLDEVTPAIHRKVTRNVPRAIGLGRDNRGRATGIELLAQRI